jgi:hypothetical protein
VAACCVDPDGRWLLRRITEGPILRGLWLPPFGDLEDPERAVEEASRLIPGQLAARPRPLPVLRHAITHRRIRVTPVRFDVATAQSAAGIGRWVDPSNHRLPTSSLFEKLLESNDL